MSWHNQLVLLSGAFQQLGSIVGGVLINAFKPFIQALNSVMGAVIQFAQTVSDALGAIFGWKFQTGGGVAQDLEYGASAAEDIEDATGGAAKKAKELNKYIAAWQEVNNMTTNDSSGGSGGGGGAGGASAGGGSAGEWVQAPSLWEKYKSEIDSLYELGEYIGDALTSTLNSIDWESVYEGARNFGSGLAEFLNGLISPELFGAVGTTVAGALNTALHALDSFGETFDWVNFGDSIAAGINNFFATFDFLLLADTLNTWANGLLDALIIGLDKVEWENIGIKIGEFLEEINFTEILGKVAKAIWKALNAALKTYKGMLETAPFETAFITVLMSTKLLSTIKTGATSLAGNVSKILTSALNIAMQYIKIGFSGGGIFDGLIDGSRAAVKTVQSELSKLSTGAKITIGAATVLGEFTLIQDGIASLLSGPDSFGEVAVSIGEIGVAALAAKPILVGVFGPAGAVIAAITGVAAAFVGINSAMEEMAENSAIGQFSQAIGDLSSEVSQKSGEINQSLENVKANVEGAGDTEAQMARDLASEYEELSNKASLSAGEKERLKQVSQDLVGIIPSLQGYIDDETGALDVQKGTLDAVIQGYESLVQKQAAQEALVDAYRAQYEAQMNVKNAQDGYNAAFNEYLTNAGIAPDVIQQIADGQLDLNQAMIDFENSPKDFLQKYGVKDYGTLKKAVYGLNQEMGSYKEALDEAYETERKAGETIDFVTGKVKESEETNRRAVEAERAATMATEEYKQSLSDLTTDFENLGVVISDSLMQDLALGEFDASSITKFFDSMKNGVQQSSGELKSMFTQLGLDLPDDLAKSLSSKEPDVQAESVKILMSIQSGVQGNKDEISTLFKNLGADLPNDLVSNLASKESTVQTATINLLAKLEYGYKLQEGSLKTIFSTLGIEVSDSLIDSLESKNADTQEQAIELLGQVQVASESERGPLIKELNDLGFDISDEYNKGLASNNDEIKNTTETMGNNTKEYLMNEFSSTTSGDMYDAGANASKGFWQGVKDWWDDSWLGRAVDGFKRTITGTSGLDEHSPSKVMEEYGRFAIQGFNIGMKGEFSDTYSMADSWLAGLTSEINGLDIQPLKLDLSVPTVDFSPKSYNVSELQSTMQMELDARMAEMEYENRQLRQSVEECVSLLESIYKKPALADDDIFNSARRGQQKFQRRTFKTGWAGVD